MNYLNLLFLLSFLIVTTNSYVINPAYKEMIERIERETKSRHMPSGLKISSQPSSRHHKVHHKKKNEPGQAQGSTPTIPEPPVTSGQVSFGQYGFFPDYIQPITGPTTVMASYPNFDYINVLRPGLENFLFSPSFIYLQPVGDAWTGLGNSKAPVVWKPVYDYPFGNDGNQPYRDLMNTLQSMSLRGHPMPALENLIEQIKTKKEKHAKKFKKPVVTKV